MRIKKNIKSAFKWEKQRGRFRKKGEERFSEQENNIKEDRCAIKQIEKKESKKYKKKRNKGKAAE